MPQQDEACFVSGAEIAAGGAQFAASLAQAASPAWYVVALPTVWKVSQRVLRHARGLLLRPR